jgi:hypothetical protein
VLEEESEEEEEEEDDDGAVSQYVLAQAIGRYVEQFSELLQQLPAALPALQGLTTIGSGSLEGEDGPLVGARSKGPRGACLWRGPPGACLCCWA